MKKILSVLLSVVTVFSAMCIPALADNSAAAAPEFSYKFDVSTDGALENGSEVNVVLTLMRNDSAENYDIRGAEMDVCFGDGFSFDPGESYVPGVGVETTLDSSSADKVISVYDSKLLGSYYPYANTIAVQYYDFGYLFGSKSAINAAQSIEYMSFKLTVEDMTKSLAIWCGTEVIYLYDDTTTYTATGSDIDLGSPTLTLDANGGTIVGDDISGSYDMNDETVLPDAEKEESTFLGWTDGTDTFAAGDTYIVSSSVTLTALWSTNEYTITFDTDGGSAVAPITADYGSAITAPADPTKANYTFAGWDAEIPTTMPAGNITITAKWTAKQYTITFDTDGGSAVAPITAAYGSAITAPADPTKANYTFAGWDAEIPTTMPAENITITAKWTAKQYTITFDTDGGSVVAPITAAYGSAITAPADPTKENYTFAGWDAEIPATMPAENITVTAIWNAAQDKPSCGDHDKDDHKDDHKGGDSWWPDFRPGKYPENSWQRPNDQHRNPTCHYDWTYQWQNSSRQNDCSRGNNYAQNCGSGRGYSYTQSVCSFSQASFRR